MTFLVRRPSIAAAVCSLRAVIADAATDALSARRSEIAGARFAAGRHLRGWPERRVLASMPPRTREAAVGHAAIAVAPGGEPATADCAFEHDIPVSILAAEFEAWKAIAGAMAECGSAEATLDREVRSELPDALAADPSLHPVADVNAATFATQSGQDLIRPLDDLVAEYGQGIPARQMVSVDGEVMAVGGMVNNRNLFYRTGAFEAPGLVPTGTYDEMLEAAAAIEAAGIVGYPIGGTVEAGFDIGEAFVNLHLGLRGTFAGAGNAVALDRDAGGAALELLEARTAQMDPACLISDTTYVQQQIRQGQVATANLWGRRAEAVDDPSESQVAGLVASAVAPLAVAGGPPVSTRRWVGWTIASNVTGEEAEAAFRAMVEATDTEMVQANDDADICPIDGYEPPAIAEGAIATLTAGVPNRPASSAMALPDTEPGDAVSAFLIGERSADGTLDEIERLSGNAAAGAGSIGE